MSKRKNPRNALQKTFCLNQTIHSLVLASALVISPTVMADEESGKNAKHHYQISSGSLSHALSAFAGSSGILLSVDARLTDGKTSNGLDGEYSVEEGFKKLLTGSGLTCSFTGDDSVAIRKLDIESNATTTLPAVTVVGKSIMESANSYKSNNSSSATKMDTALRDIPQSIQVINRKVIDDRQALTITDLANNVSGVQRGGFDFGDFPSQVYLIRGFEGKSLINGFREQTVINSYDITAVDRVDFLKGPSSVLYGQGGLGGMVNTVTKMPTPDTHLWTRGSFGSFDLYRGELDAGGNLPGNNDLFGRINFAYRNSGSYIDFHHDDNIFVSPSFTWNITPQTDLTVLLHYQSLENVFEYGLPQEPESLNVPISRFFGEPGFNNMQVESGSASYFLNHRFNDDWRFRSAFRSNMAREKDRSMMATFLYDDRRTLDREAQTFKERIDADDYALQNELYGKFKTGAVNHQVMVGTEVARVDNASGLSFAEPGTIPTIDIYNPVYGQSFKDFAAPNISLHQNTDSFGVYFQDQIEILDNLKLTGGGRYDWFNYTSKAVDDPASDARVNGEKFSPRVGLVYQPIRSTSLYFGWNNSFNPVTFGRTNGEPLKPESGEQFEIGVKQELFGERLWANLAFFEIERQNISVTDINDPTKVRQVGEQKSKGIELDIQGQPIDGLNLIASYAFTDAFVNKDTSIPIGSRLFGVPEHSGSFWGTYEIQYGMFRGFGFGSGIYVVDDSRSTGLPLASESQSTSVFNLPSYARLDSMFYYKYKNWRAQINLKNLNDEKIYETTGYSLKPQAPFSVLGSISMSF